MLCSTCCKVISVAIRSLRTSEGRALWKSRSSPACVQLSPSIAISNLLRHPKQRFAPLSGAHLKVEGKEAFEPDVLKGKPYAYQTTPGAVVAKNIACPTTFSLQVGILHIITHACCCCITSAAAAIAAAVASLLLLLLPLDAAAAVAIASLLLPLLPLDAAAAVAVSLSLAL